MPDPASPGMPLFFLIIVTALIPTIALITITTVLFLVTIAPFLIWLVGYAWGAISNMTLEKMRINAGDLASSRLTSSCVAPAASVPTQATDLLPQSVQLDMRYGVSATLNAEQESQESPVTSLESKGKTT